MGRNKVVNPAADSSSRHRKKGKKLPDESVLAEYAADRIKSVVKTFAITSFNRIHELDAEELLEENGINPLLIWALGINDFESLAKFSVYQRIGRSLVTSFGRTVIEDVVRGASDGRKGTKGTKWWDVIKEGTEENLYLCVKSGPSSMDADQVGHFCQKSKKIMSKDKKAVPIIGMCYGKKEWPVIRGTLRKNGLDPDKHAFFGKSLFDRISLNPDFHTKLPGIVRDGASDVVEEKRMIDLIESKIRDITDYFKSHYKDVEHLLQYVFEPPVGEDTSSNAPIA